MKKEDITNFRIQKVMEEESAYDFPIFLRMLRRMHGMQRKCVSEDTGIPETRLFYLENGRFKRRPGIDEIRLLSEYYGVEANLLDEKAKIFLKSGKAKPQGQRNG